MQYHSLQSNTMKLHAIPCIIINCWSSVPLPCGQYMAIFETYHRCCCFKTKETKALGRDNFKSSSSPKNSCEKKGNMNKNDAREKKRKGKEIWTKNATTIRKLHISGSSLEKFSKIHSQWTIRRTKQFGHKPTASSQTVILK